MTIGINGSNGAPLPQPQGPLSGTTPADAPKPSMAQDAFVQTPPLPAPISAPPAQLHTPDSLLKGALHAAEHDAARVADVAAKVPFLKSLGYRLYGLVAGKPKDSPAVPNLAGLTPTLYRGAQPSQEGFDTLAADGVKTVINLRPEAQWEQPMVERAGMKYVYMPLPPVGPPTDAQALQFLSTVTDPANGKVFFHCQHGADRTGAMAAAYRIAVQGWSADQAVSEMYQHHFHDGIEDEKITFVRQFATYWASLPADRRSQVLHGTPAAAPDAAAQQRTPALKAHAPAAPGASDPGGPVQFTAGNAAKLFIDRKNTYQEALRLINNAQTSIQFETFTFNGEMGQGIAQALIDARARGVNVQVVLDPKSLLVSDGAGLKALLQSHGVDVRVYDEKKLHDPVVAIDHAKTLLVDGQTALVGDSNFDRYEDYDMDYELQGPAVPQVQAMFAQSWKNARVTGQLTSDGLPPVQAVPVATGAPAEGGDTRIGLTETAPTNDGKVGDQTYQNLLGAIRNSRKSIDVLMYTMSDPKELQALQDAAARGVKVRVILSPSKRLYNTEAIAELQRAGIDVRWFDLAPGMKEMHGKVAVFDGATAVGGSTNWVHSSNSDNHELGVWMQGPVAGQIEQTFDQLWANQSTEAQLSSVGKLEAKVMDGVSRFL